MRPTAFLVIVLLSIGACGRDSTARVYDPRLPGTVTRRDSAGIAVIENTGPSWPDDASGRWTVDPTPVIDIGDGPDEHETFTRLTSAIRLGDGRTVTIDQSRREVKAFDREGRFLAIWAHGGEGPGELPAMEGNPPRLFRLAGDSILVDAGKRFLLLLDSAGTFVDDMLRGQLFGPNRQPIWVMGRVIGGDVLIARRDSSWVLPQTADSPVDLVSLLRMSSTGEIRDTIGRFLTGRAVSMVAYDASPFIRRPMLHVARDRIYYGDMQRYEVHELDLTGRLTRIVRTRHVRAPIGRESLRPFQDRMLERLDSIVDRRRPPGGFPPGRRAQLMQRMRSQIEGWVVQDSAPAYLRFTTDDPGNLWVQEFRPPSIDRQNEWTVFDTAGRELGLVTMPGDLDILQIGDDFVLGQMRDSLDVDHLRLHRLRKPNSR